MGITEKIIAFENGGLSDEEFVSLFQELVDSGHINHLQGFYGRLAMQLIEDGLVTV